MTKKDYELLAKAIAETVEHDYVTKAHPKHIYLTARYIADSLAMDNPRFDRQRFLAACGV